MKQALAAIVMTVALCLGPVTNILAETRILFLGDSLTAGLGVAKNEAWPSRLESRLTHQGFREITVINAGISGSTSASALSRLTWHMKIKPDILVLALGINDGLRGLSLAAMQKNLDKAIRLAKQNNITVILAGMEVPPNYGNEYSNGFRRVFKNLARTHGLLFVPFLLEGVGGRPELNQADGIHPNPQGHRIIAETVLPVLLEAL